MSADATELPAQVQRSIKRWFAEEDRSTARRAMLRFARKFAQVYEHEPEVRISMAVVRQSKGDRKRLASRIRLALLDWRDLLAAG